MARDRGVAEFAGTLAEALHLPRTAGRILAALARTRNRLAVDEIVRRVRRSERSVRENLSLLIRRGVLERQVFVTANRKLAYAYAIKPVEELLATARRDLARTLERVESIARRTRRATA